MFCTIMNESKQLNLKRIQFFLTSSNENNSNQFEVINCNDLLQQIGLKTIIFLLKDNIDYKFWSLIFFVWELNFQIFNLFKKLCIQHARTFFWWKKRSKYILSGNISTWVRLSGPNEQIKKPTSYIRHDQYWQTAY